MTQIEYLASPARAESGAPDSPLGPEHPTAHLSDLGVAVYTTDAEGHIMQYNEAAVELWGRRPEIGTDMWCGSLKLFWPDGTPMDHDQCPMAITLRENRPVRGMDAIAERPDGTRVHFMPIPTPLRDSNGRLVGAVNVLVDITDRKLADEARREVEERYIGLFANAPVGVFRFSFDGQVLTANETMGRILGYQSSEELVAAARSGVSHVLPEYREELHRVLSRDGETTAFEAEALRQDGTPVWLSLSVRASRDASGALTDIEGIVEDITLRKDAEAALRNSEERFSKAFRASPAAMAIVRTGDQTFVDVNQAFLDMLGYERQEVIGHSPNELDLWIDEADRNRVGQLLLANGNLTQEEVRVHTRSGGVRQVVGSADLVNLNGETCVIILVNDVTAQREWEQEQREAKANLERQLAEEQAINLISGLLRTSLDLQTVCEAALEAVARLTDSQTGLIAARHGEEAWIVTSRGVPRRALTPFRHIEATSPTLLARALFQGRATYSPQKRVPIGSAELLRKVSATRFAVIPLVAHGSVVGALHVTSREGLVWTREQRRFLTRIGDQIALAVASALQHAQVESAFRTRDEGVRATVHEIRTPLTAIKGFAQIALRMVERGDADPGTVLDSLQEIDAAAERLTNLAARMLTASSIEEGLSRLHTERCLVSTLLRDAVTEFNNQDVAANVRLARAPRVRVQCDTQLVRQVVWNLLANAARHSPPGAEIVVRAERAGDAVVICVTDSGPGVPKREQQRLFEKFFRGSAGARDARPGLGLGLYLAHQITEAHGGRIWYEDAEPCGSRFCFSLPLDRSRGK